MEIYFGLVDEGAACVDNELVHQNYFRNQSPFIISRR